MLEPDSRFFFYLFIIYYLLFKFSFLPLKSLIIIRCVLYNADVRERLFHGFFNLFPTYEKLYEAQHQFCRKIHYLVLVSRKISIVRLRPRTQQRD